MVKLRILGIAAVLLTASPAWACTEPPIEVPPIERLSGESDDAFSVRQAAFDRAFTFREGRRREATNQNALARQMVTEGQRQDARWDATTDILLAHVVANDSTAVPGDPYGVLYEIDRVLKGSSRITTLQRVGALPPFTASCPPVYFVNPLAPVGAAVIIFLPTPDAARVGPAHTLPLSELQSDRLWAIINGTTPTP